MQNVFISSLTKPLDSWKEVFPESLLLHDAAEIEGSLAAMASQQQGVVFWLHQNDALSITDAIKAILSRNQNASIVVLDNAPNHERSLEALRAGARGYAHAYSAPETLREISAVIRHGGLWLGPQLLQQIIEISTRLTGSDPDYVEKQLQRLTKREREVALEAAKGLSNKEIARVLNITERTVKAHLADTFERLQVKDRLQLALLLNKHPQSDTQHLSYPVNVLQDEKIA